MRHLPALSERWVAEYAACGGSAYWLLENVAVFEPRRERSI